MDEAVQRLVHRAQIEEVLHRYCRGVDRCDEAELAGVYHPDGTDDHGTFSGKGSDFATWACQGGRRFWEASNHTVRDVVTVVDAELWAERIPTGGRMPDDALYRPTTDAPRV